ncbi:hypothetical protein KR009_003749 [Drosophila setifemur]|nr:hypothetical protein KR009_003749 [Drosophila setifemur]
MAIKRTRGVDVFKQKKILRARFKRMVRAVIMNQQWLSDAEEQGISMNVKKNVAQMRQKRKPGILTVAEKALMRTLPESRTIEERKKLCILIAGLNCFSRIPPKIRARMVPVLKYMYINQSTVIINEGDLPISVYFILNGEVEMGKSVYNKTEQETSTVVEAVFGPGDCFGDVEMVEDCPRMNTYVALSGCEVLAIHDADYTRILRPLMLKAWNEKKLSLKAFSYFDFLNPDQIIVACKYGNVVQYEPLDTIYLGDKGSMGGVYFVLSGECVILQCLNMKVTTTEGEANFELTELDKGNGELDMFQNSKDPSRRASFVDIQEILASSSSEEEGNTKKKQAMRKMGLQEIERFCGMRTSATPGRRRQRKNSTMTTASRKSRIIQALRRGTPWFQDTDDLEDDFFGGEDRYGAEDIYEYDTSESTYESVSIEAATVPDQLQLQHNTKETTESLKQESSSSEIFTASSAESQEVPSEQAKRVSLPVETHFIDVGSLTYGGIFGLGEKMEHRVIMARTVVQCLVLPRFWLLEEEQNPGNIWQRRRFYFECNVPSRLDLFTNFLKTRQWNKFRHDYIQSLLNQDAIGNLTKEEDIPIMCRIVETSDDVI